MAQTPKDDGENSSKSSGLVPLIAVALTLALAGGGGGFAVGQYAVTSIRDEVQKDERAKRPEVAQAYSGTMRVLPLPPVVTNLKRPDTIWVRLEASAIYDASMGDVPEPLGLQIAADMNAYLSSLSIGHLEGASGLLYLKQELAERARLISDDRVKDVLVTALLIE